MLFLQQATLQLSYLLNSQTITLQIPFQNLMQQPLNELQLTSTHNKLSRQATEVQIQIRALQEVRLQQVKLHFPMSFLPHDRFFCNGFQSWTFSDEFTAADRFKPVKWFAKPLAADFGDYRFYRYTQKKGHLHGWTYGYIRHAQPAEPHLPLTFIGSLNEKNAYTFIEFETGKSKGAVAVSADCDGLLLGAGNIFSAIHLLLLCGTEEQVFNTYFTQLRQQESEQVKTVSFPEKHQNKLAGTAGWTSWYNYFTAISESVILENLHNFTQLQVPVSIFQIDDGWQQAVGDWTTANGKFPQGMGYLSRKIKDAGYLAGLWLAPFICQKQSDIFKKQPQLLLQTAGGKPVTAGYNTMWRSFMYPLNFYLPQVQDHLRQVFDTLLNQWNFDLLKLDFLYAVALCPPEGKTRGQVMYDAMQWLRQVAGNKLILGCGVPLGAAFGHTDFCRIGPDVHLSWDMPLLKWLGSREGVSTISTIKNTIHRHQLNGRAFYNDPDVSILRHQNNHLTPKQRFTLFFLNQLFGSVQFVSDNIAQYTPQTMQLYLSQFPLRQKQIHAVSSENNLYRFYFTVGNLHYLAFSNLSAATVHISLQAESHLLPPLQRSYFYNNHKQTIMPANEPLLLAPCETVCLLAVNTAENGALAGGNAHLFPCSDMVNLQQNNNNVICETQQTGKNSATVWLYGTNAGLKLMSNSPTETLQIPEGYLLKFELR